MYGEVLDLVCDTVFEEKGETYVRGKLDKILSQGKIEGRLTGLAEQYPMGGGPISDRLIEDWTKIVDSDTTETDRVIAYTVGSMWLCLSCGSGKQTADEVRQGALVSGETYLCDDCGKRIAESD